MFDRGKISSCMIVFVIIAIVSVSFAYGQSARSKTSGADYSQIKLSAFLVEAQVDAIYEDGGAARLDAVSLPRILRVLSKGDRARVISSASVTVIEGIEGEVRIEQEHGEFEIEGLCRDEDEDDRDDEVDHDDDDEDDEADHDDDDDEDHEDDDDDCQGEEMESSEFRSHLSFNADAFIIKGDLIGLKFDFSQNLVHKEEEREDNEEEVLSMVAERQWRGGMILQPGKAAIAGSTGNDGSAIFLVLRADIVK